MSNKQNQSPNNEPHSGDLLREYRHNVQPSSSPFAPPDQPKESVTTNKSSFDSLPTVPVTAQEVRPGAAQVLASEDQALKNSPKQEPPFSLSANDFSQDAKVSSAPLSVKEPTSIPDVIKKVDVLPQGIRERSGPPSTPGISARRTRLARLEESPTLPVSHDSQGIIGSTVEMVRRLTGKMAAISKTAYEPAPSPMELYRPTEPAEPQIRTRNWRRSRAVRASIRMRQRRVRAQRSSPNVQVILLSFLMVLFALLVISVSSGGAYAYSFYQSKLPQVDNIANQQIDQVSRFYDRNGVFLGDDYDPNSAGRRTYVDISTIPQVMQDAMVAAENRSFWTDPGIDPQGITRAAIDYASHGFKVEQGASTLTQQLVKDLTDKNQVTFDRKLNEGAVAIGLTQRFPKEKILEMYLNVAPFGNLRLGVESASQEYFSLTRQCTQNFAQGTFKCIPAVSQLDYDPVKKTHDPVLALARATFLASLPQDPSDYDPNVWSTRPAYRQVVLARQLSVVSAMMDMGTPVQGLGPHGQPGLITPAVRQQVATLTSKMTFKEYKRNWKDPDFMYWSISQVEHALGNGDSTKGAFILQTGGFNIRTTIDSNLEGYVERVIKHQLDDQTYQKFLTPPYTVLSDPNGYNVGDAASVVMNSKTGEILALAGSKDYNSTAKDPRVAGQVDVATNSDGTGLFPRQPGSSFKPIVYATAFEMGWYPGLVLPDEQTTFPNGQPTGTTIDTNVNKEIWSPNDYGGKPGNHVLPIRYNIANSFNIPAGKAMAFAGADNVYNTAVRMGITSIADQGASCLKKKEDMAHCLSTSLALGTYGVPLIQLTGAYQTFSDNGVHVPQQVVLDIWNNYGNHLYHFDPTQVQKSQVISPQVAYMVTSMMADEGARALEFTGDHDLSFWDWEPSCSAQSYRPYPDCQQMQVAAKTGTTENFSDNLTVGYTPDVTVGVWAGNADNSYMHNVVGITGAAPIWNAIISRLSGKHCSDADGVTCGFLDLKGLGLSDQGVFTNPGGLEVKCVSSTDGLMGDGGNDCDLTLPNQAPLQSGIFSAMPKNNDGGNNNGGNNHGGNNNGGNNGGNNNGGNNGGGGKRPG